MKKTLGEMMHVQRLAAAASTLSAAALLLMGSAVPAQALSCAPGSTPSVVDGAQACIPAGSAQPEPSPYYNPGESHYDPATGNYSEAVPAPYPVPAESPAPAQAAPSQSPAPSGAVPAPAPAGAPVIPAPAATPSPAASPGTSRTPSPTPSPAAHAERAGMDTVLPAAAAVLILGVLAGALLRRHRNRTSRG